ncbi:MAG TPA: glycosyltransferase [Stellaceae bacterium]|jgi:glycosyltransferase involved in cell wall biosynthesis|nr:glycosyltransferase [Stellaceae bacterium]
MVGLLELPKVTTRLTETSSVDVLHLPYTYFPDAPGGTEVYVAGLVAALRREGVGCAVAAPGKEAAEYSYSDAPVFRFATARDAGLAQAYGAPDAEAERSVRALLARLRPRIVHLHARTAAVSGALVDAAREVGAKTVFTYHTPTVSCARGTMMRLGRVPCDGVLDRRRCTACVFAQHGVPPLMRDALASVPEAIGARLGRAGLGGGAFTALRLPALIGAGHRRFHELMHKVDRVVAVCEWVREVLRMNGVPEDKLLLCRQGLVRGCATPMARARAIAPRTPLRLGYFGRLDPTKGADLLAAALRRVPRAPVQLAIYGVRQPGRDDYADSLGRAALEDPRITLLPALPPEQVGAAMGQCDLVAVPSRCLETGPLVVLEAFAAGVPLLGARLGGIAELVTDGIDGVLVPPDDAGAWAAAIAALATAPERVAALRAGIRPPRTMRAVAGEMASLYRKLLADGAR